MISELAMIYALSGLLGIPVVTFLSEADDVETVLGRAILWPAFLIKFLVNVIRKDLFS